MKAVNLVPGDGRTRRSTTGNLPFGYLLVGALVAVLALVTLVVLTGNTISERRAKLSALQQQLTTQQVQAARLVNYAQFQKLAEARAQTVRQIAATRFDWYSALSDLSRVVPANTSLNWLYGSVAPGATISGTGTQSSGVANNLRSDLSVPAFELNGCTKTQDDVARLMSRLRLINGVTRVTLGDSQQPDSVQSGGPAGSSSATQTAQDCGPDTPSFDLVVFFQALPGAGPNGIATSAAGPGTASQSPSTPASGAPAAGPSSAGAPAATPVTTPVTTAGKP